VIPSGHRPTRLPDADAVLMPQMDPGGTGSLEYRASETPPSATWTPVGTG